MPHWNDERPIGLRAHSIAVRLIGALWLSAIAAAASGQQPGLDVIRQSSLIFDAEIISVRSSIMAAVPASGETVVARVQQVISKPDAIALSPGQEVVVIFPAPPDVSQGSRLRIFGNGRIFAETIAVEALTSATVTADSTRSSTNSPEEVSEEQGRVLGEQIAQETLKERLADASAVVVGQVREVRIPTTKSLAPEAGARFSEHDAQWREAIINVQQGLKGAESGSDVVVRFPASEDVMWFDYPKLSVGERRVFILQRDTLTGAPTAALAGEEVPAYTLIEKADPLPESEANRIRSLLP